MLSLYGRYSDRNATASTLRNGLVSCYCGSSLICQYLMGAAVKYPWRLCPSLSSTFRSIFSTAHLCNWDFIIKTVHHGSQQPFEHELLGYRPLHGRPFGPNPNIFSRFFIWIISSFIPTRQRLSAIFIASKLSWFTIFQATESSRFAGQSQMTAMLFHFFDFIIWPTSLRLLYKLNQLAHRSILCLLLCLHMPIYIILLRAIHHEIFDQLEDKIGYRVQQTNIIFDTVSSHFQWYCNAHFCRGCWGTLLSRSSMLWGTLLENVHLIGISLCSYGTLRFASILEAGEVLDKLSTYVPPYFIVILSSTYGWLHRDWRRCWIQRHSFLMIR